MVQPAGSYYELSQDDAHQKNIVCLLGATKYPSHFHRKPEVTYVLKGSCASVVGQARFVAEEDDILFISEYNPHSYETTEDAERIIFLADDTVRNDVLPLLGNMTFPVLLDHKAFNREKILPVLKEMLPIQTADPKSPAARAKYLLLKGYVDVVYGLLYGEYSDELIPVNKQNSTVAKILNYIEEHCTENLTLESVAQEFAYNKFHFSKLFSSCVGMNFTAYVNSVRIRRFVKLYDPNLRNNMLPLALDVGFKSMPSFYRAFERIYHCTPTEYFKHT